MTDKKKIILERVLTILGYVIMPFWIVLLIIGIPFLIIHSIIIDRIHVKRFHEKYPSKRFLIINKNDPDYLRAYSEILENRIGKDSVVLNELDLEKVEYSFEKKLYKSDLSTSIDSY